LDAVAGHLGAAQSGGVEVADAVEDDGHEPFLEPTAEPLIAATHNRAEDFLHDVGRIVVLGQPAARELEHQRAVEGDKLRPRFLILPIAQAINQGHPCRGPVRHDVRPPEISTVESDNPYKKWKMDGCAWCAKVLVRQPTWRTRRKNTTPIPTRIL